MPCFAMLSSCSMLISCSEHCYLMLFLPCSVFSPSLWSWYLLHFCHACLNLLWSGLAVAHCSSFVKHLLKITVMCFVAMLECCSIVACCILSAIMLLIADSCHPCFACHLQTVHPFPVIFISTSTKSSHLSSGMLGLPSYCLFHHFSSGARICITYHILHIIHVLHHVACALHRDWLWFHCLCYFVG